MFIGVKYRWIGLPTGIGLRTSPGQAAYVQHNGVACAANSPNELLTPKPPHTPGLRCNVDLESETPVLQFWVFGIRLGSDTMASSGPQRACSSLLGPTGD
jgi:hypothetical protein